MSGKSSRFILPVNLCFVYGAQNYKGNCIEFPGARGGLNRKKRKQVKEKLMEKRILTDVGLSHQGKSYFSLLEGGGIDAVKTQHTI